MATNGKPGNALAVLANRLDVQPEELKQTLTQTVFKGASDAQMTALCIVANEYGLNPFVKELYAFPSQNGIVPMVSIDGWLRIINEHPKYTGMDIAYAEKTVKVDKSKECPEYIEVTIHRSDRPHTSSPIREYLDECYRNTQPWNQMTRRQLRHKAIMQAARVVMGLHGIFDEDEAADVLAREGKTIVKVGDEYDVIEAEAVDETGEVIGADEYSLLLEEMKRTQISLESIAKNVAAKAGYHGELADMPLPVWESLMAGLATMPSKTPTTPPDDEPTTATQSAVSGDETPKGESAATEAAGDAESADFWPQEGAPDQGAPEEEPPGRGALFSADDPNRPATASDKKQLSEALAHVPTAEVKAYRKRFEGRSNSELTHGEIEAFRAWAVEKVLA